MIARLFGIRLVILLLAALLLAACQSPAGLPPVQPETSAPAPTAGQADAGELFAELADEIFRYHVTSDTLTLHFKIADPENYSIDDIAPTLGRVDAESSNEYNLQVLSWLDTLRAFPYYELSENDRITYDVLLWYLGDSAAYRGFDHYGDMLFPTTGIQAILPILMVEYAFRKEKDIISYLGLLSDLGRYFGDIVTYQQEKSAAGLFMADRALDSVIEQCEALIEDEDGHFVVATFDSKIDALDFLTDEQKADYKAENLAAVHAHFFPAYQLLIDGLEELRGTGQNEDGLYYFPNGKEYYALAMKSESESEKSADEIKNIAFAQFEADMDAFFALLGGGGDFAEELASLSIDTSEPTSIMEQLRQDMLADFPPLPDVNYEVKKVEPSMEGRLSPAFFLIPPIDLLTENVIYFDPTDSMFDDGTMFFSTMAHEGFPGHLYQTVYSGLSELDNVRHIFNAPAYSEGWATLAELYSFDYLGLNPETAELLKLEKLLDLGLSAILDIMVHYEGWTITEAGEFLGGFGYDDPDLVDDFYQYIIAHPAIYLKYYLGYIGMAELRGKIEAERGDAFSSVDFHDKILSFGPAPFSVLEKYLLGA
ncbi:MAG: DUF885 domain-containing protein [Clostridiales bacterium]|nr:DUF885 domain-containing protein [Clostridiales bacterium]